MSDTKLLPLLTAYKHRLAERTAERDHLKAQLACALPGALARELLEAANAVEELNRGTLALPYAYDTANRLKAAIDAAMAHLEEKANGMP